MSIIKIFSGTKDIVTDPVLPCQKDEVYLIIGVFDDMAEDMVKCANAPMTVTRGMTTTPTETDANGYFTIHFTDLEDLLAAKLRIAHGTAHSAYLLSEERTHVSKNVYRAHAFLGLWELQVSVVDGRLPGSNAVELPLKEAPIRITWDDATNDRPKTGSDGQPFTFNKMACGTTYNIEVRIEGIVKAETHVIIENADGEQSSVSVDRKVTLMVNSAKRVVKVKFQLAFEKVLIVGEGNNFRYAIPLAEKYLGKWKGRSFEPRKWIVASQYDVDEPAKTVETLYIYRDAESENGRFDATDATHWSRLGARHGKDFEVAIFNNPHPGYGMHMCEVMGVQTDGTEAALRGKYISVHSIGYDGKLSQEQSGQFKITESNTGASVQRAFLRGLDIIRDGTDHLMDFTGGNFSQKTIRQVFAPIVDYVNSSENFRAAETHYNPVAATIGLKEHLLKKFAEFAVSILRAGGGIHINGSRQIGVDLEKAGLLLSGDNPKGFRDAGTWKEHGIYFVQYPTNFTSVEHHPSWYAKVDFTPGEPNLNAAHVFAATK